jgi:UPF0271 protein
LNLNADLGEGAGDDVEILACVDSASVACGVHAGSVSITVATALRCLALGIEVGAHPGYDDRANFGRAEVSLSSADLEALIAFQVAGLSAIAPVRYVKPHGALYHRCQHDAAAADVLARVARDHGVGVVGQPGFEIIAAAKRARIPGHREGFADRRLRPDGSLTPRTQPGAMLDAASAAEQAVTLARTGEYDTICVHGDTPGAGQVAAAVRRALDEAGIATSPLGGRL